MRLPTLKYPFGSARGPAALPSGASPALGSFSNLAGTAYKRHVQSLHEHGDRRNPDLLAGALLSPAQREQCLHLQARALDDLRRSPYYHYLTARTKAYDQVLLDAVAGGIRRVLIMGSGFDTRLYRFGGHLAALGAEVAECDQPPAMAAKRQLAAALPYACRVQYLGIDLNLPDTWAGLLRWLGDGASPALLIAEGVSPYIQRTTFTALLEALPKLLPTGSRVAYDFKLAGVADDFGKGADVSAPFRLALNVQAIAELHAGLGYRHTRTTDSRALMRAHVPSWDESVSPLFHEDALVELVC